MEEKTKEIIGHDPADLNKDGKVTKVEKGIYEFFQGIYEASNKNFAAIIQNIQSKSFWTILGSMAFLALLYILDLVRTG